MERTVRAEQAAVKESRRHVRHIDKRELHWYTSRVVSRSALVFLSLCRAEIRHGSPQNREGKSTREMAERF